MIAFGLEASSGTLFCTILLLGCIDSISVRKTDCDIIQWNTENATIKLIPYLSGMETKYVERCKPLGEDTRKDFRLVP
jgi:hypothetical protein